MSVEKNKETAEKIFAALRANEIEAVAGLVTAGFATHAKGITPDALRGPDAVRERLEANREETPGSTFEIRDLFGEGDRLAVHMEWTAPVGGDDPTATIGGTNIEVWRFEDGLLAESWVCRDA